MMMMKIISVTWWNIVASLLFLIAVHRNAATAVVAESEGEFLLDISFVTFTSRHVSYQVYFRPLCWRVEHEMIDSVRDILTENRITPVVGRLRSCLCGNLFCFEVLTYRVAQKVLTLPLHFSYIFINCAHTSQTVFGSLAFGCVEG